LIRLNATSFYLNLPSPPTSTLFPYTTLFRSANPQQAEATGGVSVHTPSVLEFVFGSPDLADHETWSWTWTWTWSWTTVVVGRTPDRKSTRLNSSHVKNSYAVFCLKKKKHKTH